jgi:hypothetical protein
MEALPEVCFFPLMVFVEQAKNSKVYEIEPLQYYKHVNVTQEKAP